MANLDLRTLSAPLEALRPDVEAAYQRLDRQWESIAEHLKGLPIPCSIEFVFDYNEFMPERYSALEWRKINGSKRFCIVNYDEDRSNYEQTSICSIRPFEEWSAEERVNMLQHIPGLFEAATRQTKEFIEKIGNGGGNE
ncbi:hypothetical protein [Rubinisphaera margarita]|uniref:hypothetical protein n=1 Tax=Rubinisphaera margarita TaxID=2909586 RepID=UPI001EE90BEE|nr:hypothetical protein [Rubinisphaera margarita]MCG6155535.1 hypothetical protein [Rubinisphaera margarita]